MTPDARARAPALAALTALALLACGCAPGSDGALTVVDQGLLPAQLRVVHATDDGGVWAAGHHEGSLAGVALHGVDGTLAVVPGPRGLLWDYAHVDVDEHDGVVWLTATSHVFRLEDAAWEIFRVPDPVIDGVVAGAFPADRLGWIAGQDWDGPRIYRFGEAGFAEEESIEGVGADVSLSSLLVRDHGVGYAAGVRRGDEDEALLLRRDGEDWVPVALPLDPAQVGPIRDLAWAGDGDDVWVVGDRLLRGAGDDFEEQSLPATTGQFVARVGAFPADGEGWIAGFGVEGLFHLRGGVWEAVPAERLAPAVPAGTERTWLFDDAHFATPRNGWLVGSFVDCDDGGGCTHGEALVHYDRDDSTRPWTVDDGWRQPPESGTTAPPLLPTAVEVAPDGATWISGDAAPGGPLQWNQPQTWRRAPGGNWELQELPVAAVIHDLRFDEHGDAWAVGAVAVAEKEGYGVALRYQDGVWSEEEVGGIVSTDWSLKGVAWDAAGTVYAVGRRGQLPLAVARVDGVWEVLHFSDYVGATGMDDVTVNEAGVVWAVGTSWLGSGGTAGYLATGNAEDGLAVMDLSDHGRMCGPDAERYPCWSLRGVDAGPDGTVAVGEATVLSFTMEGIHRTETNMTLIGVSFDGPGLPWVLAENGWWEPSFDSWTVQRHWDGEAAAGTQRSLEAASPTFGLVAGHRERHAGAEVELVGAFTINP